MDTCRAWWFHGEAAVTNQKPDLKESWLIFSQFKAFVGTVNITGSVHSESPEGTGYKGDYRLVAASGITSCVEHASFPEYLRHPASIP